MFALALLLGLVPYRPDVRSGPPAPHLATTPSRQWRLSNRAAWRDFRDRWGGRWAARWDERTGAPRFLYAPGVAASDALVADVARLAHVDPTELRFAGEIRHGERAIQRWTRSWRGAKVLGDELALFTRGGRVAGIKVQLSPTPSTPPRPGEVVFPRPTWGAAEPWTGPSVGVQPVLVTIHRDGPDVVYLDRGGAEVQRYDTRMFDSISVAHYARTVDDPLVTDPARGVTVDDGASTDITDDAGAHGLSGAIQVELTGPDAAITTDGATITVDGEGDLTLTSGDQLTPASAVALHHFHVAWDWLADRWPDHAWLGQNVPIDVDISDSACNAWYTSGTINFLQGWPGSCNNLGEVADVHYHELGHGIHQYILAAGTFAGDVSEGSADFVSATINDDPEVGPNSYPGGGYVRELATDHVYPDDVSGEVHNDGLIWGSFLWDLREQWKDTYGDEAGVEQTDLLFLGALEQGPTLTDLYEAVILADDDDGDLSNGTPHACELVELLDTHGIGPGPIGVVQFDHDPLNDQPSDAEGYPIEFQLYDLTPDCGGLDPDSVALLYTTDEGASLDDEWTALDLETDGTTWTGAIPRQPATTHVRYTIQATSVDGTQTVTTDGGDPSAVYEFYVGDLESLWCEGFEDGAPDWVHGGGRPDSPDAGRADEWQFGGPTGAAYTPDVAWEGAAIAATDLEGSYDANGQQYLQSPLVSLDHDGPLLLLRFQRWLTVEDGLYDHALVFADDTALWANPVTERGEAHVLDDRWTRQAIDLSGLDGDPVRFAWTLDSDPGLEFGGWALDQVCVVQLADLAGHYRVDDLDASDTLDTIQLSWTQPWMVDLETTALTRRRDRAPTAWDDGVIVELDTDPQPGATHALTDPDARAGDHYYYAVFVEGGAEGWFTEVVNGENADEGAVPAEDSGEPGDTGEAADTAPLGWPDAPTVEVSLAGRSCGCAGGGSAAVLLLFPLLAVRRR